MHSSKWSHFVGAPLLAGVLGSVSSHWSDWSLGARTLRELLLVCRLQNLPPSTHIIPLVSAIQDLLWSTHTHVPLASVVTGRVFVHCREQLHTNWQVYLHAEHTRWNLAIISSGRRNCISITESENMASHSNCHQCPAFTMWIMSIRNDLRFSPSVLWHCWLGDRKGIPPVKKLGVALLVVMIWLEICTYYSSSCQHHLHNPWLQ